MDNTKVKWAALRHTGEYLPEDVLFCCDVICGATEDILQSVSLSGKNRYLKGITFYCLYHLGGVKWIKISEMYHITDMIHRVIDYAMSKSSFEIDYNHILTILKKIKNMSDEEG